MKIDTPTTGLRAAALSGARWSAAARLVAETSTLAASVVLARLIPPAEFGRAAVALIVVALAAVLGTAGLVAPLVQRRELDQRHVQTATFLALVVGVTLTAATAAFGLVVAPGLFDARTGDFFVLTSGVWLLVGLGASSQALLQRQFRFRRQAEVEAASVVLSIVVSLSAALAGLDGEALIAGALTLMGSTALLSLASAPPGLPRPHRQEAGEICRFAGPVAGSSLAYLGYRNVDYAILGAQASAAQVGFYWRAFQLGVSYQGKLSRVMLRISLPLFARAGSTEELRHIRMRIVRTHATILIPLLATFVGVAPVLVPWLFGAAWEPTVLPAQILAVAGMADAVMTGSGPLMVAIGRPGALLTWNVFQLGCYALLVALLAPHGVVVLAVGVAAFGVASALGLHGLLLRRYVGLSFRRLWLDIRAGVAVGALVVVTVSLLRVALESVDAPDVVTLASLAVTSVAVASLALVALFRPEWNDVVAIVRRSPEERFAVTEP